MCVVSIFLQWPCWKILDTGITLGGALSWWWQPGGLRAQLAQQNQGPPDAEVPPAPVNQPAAPEIPDVDPVIPENPIAPEVPVVPVAVPPAPLVRTPEELYDRFRHMKAPEFEGSTNPIEADNL
ncbi:hypothetical protein TIFTF001_048765 [Ficus carica]|uniref:Uncharacterized protein n=1 Tax=Ficus carica TaxID=3494 RepID=A0AA87Z9M5_FICCA|nr:hypothetical protein TIFTF001_048765 [Ficus carica]